MFNTRALLIPGVLIGSLALIGLTSLIAAPTPVEAASAAQPAVTAAAPASKQTSPTRAPSSNVGSACSLKSGFPQAVRQWCGFIQQYAESSGVEPALVAAVIWLESGGSADAYSKSGAVGLMQVMPRDGLAASFQCANGPCFASRPSMQELYDPEFNISYGVRMLAGLFQRNGSWREALKAYGPINYGYTYADRVLSLYEKNR